MKRHKNLHFEGYLQALMHYKLRYVSAILLPFSGSQRAIDLLFS